MSRSTLFDRVCCPRAMMAYHARRCRPCVMSKGSDVMPRLTSSYPMSSPRAVMSCHAQRYSTGCAAQRQLWHATSDVVQLFVLPKGDDGMPRATSFDRLCFPKVMLA